MVDLIPEQYCKKDLIIRHLQVQSRRFLIDYFKSRNFPDDIMNLGKKCTLAKYMIVPEVRFEKNK